MKIALIPHSDDEALFLSYTIQRDKPVVVIVFDGYVQAARGSKVTAVQRRKESEAACKILGVDPPIFLGFRDDAPDWGAISQAITGYRTAERVYAPAIEDGGHVHHNELGQMASQLFPTVTHFMTYTRSGKSLGVEVVPEPAWIARKLRALACYESQIAEPSCREHFLRDLREYTQA